jgi:hypothetical protein
LGATIELEVRKGSMASYILSAFILGVATRKMGEKIKEWNLVG